MSERSRLCSLNQARRMRAAGVPLDLSQFDDPLMIEQQVTGILGVEYFCGNSGGVTITTRLKITCESNPQLKICEFELALPWTEAPAMLLAEPLNPTETEIYRFPGERDGGYHKSDVIGAMPLLLRQGTSIEGFFLAYGHDSLPDCYLHGQKVVLPLHAFDQFNAMHTKELLFKVDRTPKPKSFPRTRQGRLFDRRDPVPVK